MSDEEVGELVDGFIQIIQETLASTPLSTYTTTALIVDHNGDIEFQMIVTPEYLDVSNANRAAYELGRELASRRSDIAAVLVAEQLIHSKSPDIILSIETLSGYRSAVLLPVKQALDRTIRVEKMLPYKLLPRREVSDTGASLVVQGLMTGKREREGS